MVGNLATDANFKLTNAGFVVTSDTAASDQPVGEVIDQNPAAGLMVARGSTVTITVSNGPDADTGAGDVPAPPPGQSGNGNGKAKGRDKDKDKTKDEG